MAKKHGLGPVMVLPNKEGGWDVRRQNSNKVSVHKDTKVEAIQRANTIAENAGTEVTIFNRDNKIGEKNSQGNDPCPPKDKR